jgi:glucokinase
VFDVGGTLLRGGVFVAKTSTLADVRAVDSPSYLRHPGLSWPELRGRLLDAMTALRDDLDPGGEISSVAVSFPGPIDVERRVRAAPPLWGALGEYPFDLERALADAWPGTDVAILNDVTAAGYRYVGEAGADFAIVAVSTGIGSKLFVAGRPLLGARGQGGEIGHLRVDMSSDAAPCDCGGRGHLAALASGRGVLARAREAAGRAPDEFLRSSLGESTGGDPTRLSAETIAVAYRAGDAWAAARVAAAAQALAGTFATIHLAAGVDRFVLIGGFAIGLGPTFCNAVQSAASERCWRGESGDVTVTLGQSDGRCALVGAGVLAHSRADTDRSPSAARAESRIAAGSGDAPPAPLPRIERGGLV